MAYPVSPSTSATPICCCVPVHRKPLHKLHRWGTIGKWIGCSACATTASRTCLSVHQGRPRCSSASGRCDNRAGLHHTENIRTRQLCTRINPVLEHPPQRDHNEVLNGMWSPSKEPACSPRRCRPAPQDLQVSCAFGPPPCTRTALQTPHGWDLWVYWPKGGQESGELPLLTRFP